MKHSNHKSLPKTGRGGIDYWLHVYIQYIYIYINIYLYIYLFAPDSRAFFPGEEKTWQHTSGNQASNEPGGSPNDELHEGAGMKLSILPSFKQELLANPFGPTGTWFSVRSKISTGMRDELPDRLSGLRIWAQAKGEFIQTNVTANLNFCRHRTLASWMGLLIWHQPVTSPRTLPLQTTSQTIL